MVLLTGPQRNFCPTGPKNIFRKMFFGLGGQKMRLYFRNYYFLNFNLKSNNSIYKCNFCMGDLGKNGIADLKHKKFPPTGPHFRPRALRALGRKWRPQGGNFLCFRSAIPFMPSSPMQKLPIFGRFCNCKKWNLVKKNREIDLFDFVRVFFGFFAMDFFNILAQYYETKL